MRLILRVTVSAAAALTVALAGSSAAQADDASFVRDAKAIGARHSDVNIISTGRSACYFLTRNRDVGQVTTRISKFLLITPEQAQRFLVRAVAEYCPQYGGQVGV